MKDGIDFANDFVIENEVLVKYTGSSPSITIPQGIKKIGKRAFANTSIEEVIFPSDSLQSIDEEAFKSCRSLEFIELPEGLVQIGEKAFVGCTSLKCAIIPSSVLLLESTAFDGCSSDFYVIALKVQRQKALPQKNGTAFKRTNRLHSKLFVPPPKSEKS